MQIRKATLKGVTPDSSRPGTRYFRFLRAFGELFSYGKQYHVPGVDANPASGTTNALCMMIGSDPGQMAVPLVLDEVPKIAGPGEMRAYSTEDGKTEKHYVWVAVDGVRLNGTQFGGLIKIQELTDKLNELIALYNNHTHSITTLKPSVSAPGFDKTDYENTEVNHGGYSDR